MPAIQLSRLRKQAENLPQFFNNPEKLTQEIIDLFEYYSDRTFRPGVVGRPIPIINSYKIATPVLQEILAVLSPIVATDPQSSLALVDNFWKKEILELRILAADLIGKIPLKDSKPIVERILVWVLEYKEDSVLERLSGKGMKNYRSAHKDDYYADTKLWLTYKERKIVIFALLVLLADLQEIKFENLPIFLRLLAKYIENPPKYLIPYLSDLVKLLAKTSPQETTFFLRKSYLASKNASTKRIIRISLDSFPKEAGKSLKDLIK
ncbi:MAG: DNA alkylation repair protein [Chloroflexota bacterium]